MAQLTLATGRVPERTPWGKGRKVAAGSQEPMRENVPSPIMTTIIRFPF